MSRLVIFDIDGTLVPGASSEVRFARYLWRHRVLGPRQIAAFVWFVLRYWPRFPGNVMQKNKAYLAGLEVERVAQLAAAFVRADLIHTLYSPTLERLRSHQAAGEYVVLLSGTPSFLAAALAEALDAQDSVGAQCAESAGRYTGCPPATHPYGKTKLQAAAQLSQRSGLTLDQAIAYGDSAHDAWLFRAVGEGVAVMPDRQLREAAAGEGWEIFG